MYPLKLTNIFVSDCLKTKTKDLSRRCKPQSKYWYNMLYQFEEISEGSDAKPTVRSDNSKKVNKYSCKPSPLSIDNSLYNCKITLEHNNYQ